MGARMTVEAGPAGRARGAVAMAGLALLFGLGCAPVQVVPLSVEPTPGSLHVDGRAVSPVPDHVELRADRDHKLYFKRDGYRPELVILRSQDGEAGPRLEPARVQARLQPLSPGARDVQIEREGEREGEAGP